MDHFAKITSIKNPLDLSEYLSLHKQLNLISMKDKYEANLLHHCAFNNVLENLKVLIRHVKDYYESHDSVISARYDRKEQLQMNLSAWINQANYEGYLSVHYACLHGNVEMVKYLEELGGNLLYKTKQGDTLAHLCAQNDQVGPLLYLTSKKVDFNDVNSNGETPLWQAASKGSNEVASLLVAINSVDINKPDKNQETPLIIAVKENKSQIVKRLLLKGADRNLKNNEDKTAYEVARQINNRKLARILNLQRSFGDRIKILCNKKIVYNADEASPFLVVCFIVMFLTSALPTNIVIDIPLIDAIAVGIFYGIYAILYISLLFGPKKKPRLPLKDLIPPICPQCRTEKTPKSYHCFMCKTCIYRYDHHCPWINNCVGWHNTGRFTIFLVLTDLALLETLILTVFEGIVRHSYRFQFASGDTMYSILHIWTIVICLFMWPVTTLLVQQMKALMLNKTGYERHRSPSSKAPKKESLIDASVQSEQEVEVEVEEDQVCSFGNCFKMLRTPPSGNQIE